MKLKRAVAMGHGRELIEHAPGPTPQPHHRGKRQETLQVSMAAQIVFWSRHVVPTTHCIIVWNSVPIIVSGAESDW